MSLVSNLLLLSTTLTFRHFKTKTNTPTITCVVLFHSFEIHLQTGAKPRWSTSAFLAKVSFPSHDITAVECVDMHRGKKGEKTTVDGNLPIYRHRHCIVKIIVEADCYTVCKHPTLRLSVYSALQTR